MPSPCSAPTSDGDPLTYEVTAGPGNGSLSGTAPDLTYTPDPGFVGTDTFEYRVNDGTVWSATSVVTINVNATSTLPFTEDFESGAGDWSALYGPGSWSTTTVGGSTWFRGSVGDGRDSSAQTAGDSGWTDYAIDVDAVTDTVLRRGDGPAVLARVVDGANHYAFRFDNNRWVVESVVGGSATKVGQGGRTGLNTGAAYDIRVEVQGTNLRLYVNGSLEVSVSDGSHAAGAVGLGVHGSVSRFDNVAVTALP